VKENNVLWVKAADINHFQLPPHFFWYGRLASKKMPRLLKRIAHFTYVRLTRNIWRRGNWDVNSKKFNNTDWHILIEDLIKKRNNYKNSIWYKRAKSSVNSLGLYIYKNRRILSEKDLDSFFVDYILKLIDSIDDHGWNESLSPDLPTGMIGRSGEIIKSGAGCHRLAIMRILNPNMLLPLKIVAIHPYIKKNKVPKNIEKFISNFY